MQSHRFDCFDRDPTDTATLLLGQRLVRIVNGKRVAGIIVEVEAYLGAADQAAHTFGGRRTKRNESMYLAGGHAYVYMIYGLHHCFNVVCGGKDEGVAVLVRAVEPTEGSELMTLARGHRKSQVALCSGPARLTQALQIDRSFDGEDLRQSSRLFIERVRTRRLSAHKIATGPRVGVGYAGSWAQKPLRFWIAGNSHVSPARVASTDSRKRLKNS